MLADSCLFTHPANTEQHYYIYDRMMSVSPISTLVLVLFLVLYVGQLVNNFVCLLFGAGQVVCSHFIRSFPLKTAAF